MARSLLRWVPLLPLTSLLALGAACGDPLEVAPNLAGGAGGAGDEPQVGDPYRDESTGRIGKVVNVNNNGCTTLTVEFAPLFQCSQQILNELGGSGAGASGGAGGYGAGGFASGGVTGGGAVGPTPAGTSPAVPALQPKSCGELTELGKALLAARSSTQLAYARHQRLVEQCLPTTITQVLGNCDYFSSGGTSSGGATAGGTLDGSPDTATTYSTTNNQELAVDEADYVKNDGGTAFVAGPKGIHVVDVWPAESMNQLALIPIAGEPRRLFLADNRLVVYSRLAGVDGNTGYLPSNQGCTYGYDCRFQSEGGSTLVSVFDVSTPVQPKLLTQHQYSGAFVAARRVGNVIYTVVHDSGEPNIPGVRVDVNGDTPEAVNAEFLARSRENERLVRDAGPEVLLPWAKVGQNAVEVPADHGCGTGLSAPGSDGTSFVSLMAFDVTQLGKPTRTTIATSPGFVYSSAENLYLAVDGTPRGEYWGAYSDGANEWSSLHKLSLSGTKTAYVGSAPLKGHVLNQFAMDEQSGVLRVASTSGWVPDPSVSSNVTTFSSVTGNFQQLGILTDLAPTEDIRSVRFDGDRAFVVTFKKTDPLFVIDVAKPATPKVLGELKIPGFSTYMHPIDHDNLLAVGFDADDQGDFAYFNGIQIQLFDVSVLSAPKLKHKATIGTRGSASEALLNHLAFNYFAPIKKLALPMTICEGGGNGTYGDQLTFSGLMVFDVDVTTGIKEVGRMPFVDTAVASGVGCNQWWSTSMSDVKRSIFLDNYVVGISDSKLQSAALGALDKVLATVPLATTP